MISVNKQIDFDVWVIAKSEFCRRVSETLNSKIELRLNTIVNKLNY